MGLNNVNHLNGRWREKGSLGNRMLRKDKRPLGEQAEVSFVTRSVR